MAINKHITSAPLAPQRSDPNTFADRADAFVAWLENLDDELNQWASECNSTEENMNNLRDETEQLKNDTQNIKEQAVSETEAIKEQAEEARDYANKWATEAEDTAINDGVNPEGYSAYHYARKSEEWYIKVSTSQLWTATSNTSVEVGTGSKTFTLNEENRSFNVGSKLRIVATSDPVNIWLEGIVTDYTGNNLTVNIGSVNGSGTYSDWKISLSAGGDASSINGYETSLIPKADSIVVSNPDGKIDGNWLAQGDGSGFNADKVDNFHASQTPSADTIPVAGSNGKLDPEWIPLNAVYQEFTESGTWTKPEWCNFVYVEVIGGGGGGERRDQTARGGCGGMFLSKLFKASNLPSEVDVVVGAGGSGSSFLGGGQHGGSSSFGNFLEAPGGAGNSIYLYGSYFRDIETLRGVYYGAGFDHYASGDVKNARSTLRGGGGGGGVTIDNDNNSVAVGGGESMDGKGGNGAVNTSGGNGEFPGGGGGGTIYSDGKGGDGADGVVRIWCW